jgi:hypothetical protein
MVYMFLESEAYSKSIRGETGDFISYVEFTRRYALMCSTNQVSNKGHIPETLCALPTYMFVRSQYRGKDSVGNRFDNRNPTLSALLP